MFFPLSTPLWIWDEYHEVNFLLKKDIANLFTVKSSGWKLSAMFAGTLTRQMLYSLRMLSTASVIWLQNTSIMKGSIWSEFLPKHFLSSFTCGLIISSISFKLSYVLLKCFSSALNENSLERFTFGKLCWVFPPQMSWIGRKLLSRPIPNVAVNDLR